VKQGHFSKNDAKSTKLFPNSTPVPQGTNAEDTTLGTLIVRYISPIYNICFSRTDFERAAGLSSPSNLYYYGKF